MYEHIQASPIMLQAFNLFVPTIKAYIKEARSYNTIMETREGLEQPMSDAKQQGEKAFIRTFEQSLNEAQDERRQAQATVTKALREHPELKEPYHEIRRAYQEIRALAEHTDYDEELKKAKREYTLDTALLDLLVEGYDTSSGQRKIHLFTLVHNLIFHCYDKVIAVVNQKGGVAKTTSTIQ